MRLSILSIISLAVLPAQTGPLGLGDYKPLCQRNPAKYYNSALPEVTCLLNIAQEILEPAAKDDSDTFDQKKADRLHQAYEDLSYRWGRAVSYTSATSNSNGICKNYEKYMEKLAKMWEKQAELLPKVVNKQIMQKNSKGAGDTGAPETNNVYQVTQTIGTVEFQLYSPRRCGFKSLPKEVTDGINPTIQFPEKCPQYKDAYKKALDSILNSVDVIGKSYNECTRKN